MKKILFVFCLFSVLAACKREDDIANKVKPNPDDYPMKSASIAGVTTADGTFEDGDVVLALPRGGFADSRCLVLTYAGEGSWRVSGIEKYAYTEFDSVYKHSDNEGKNGTDTLDLAFVPGLKTCKEVNEFLSNSTITQLTEGLDIFLGKASYDYDKRVIAADTGVLAKATIKFPEAPEGYVSVSGTAPASIKDSLQMDKLYVWASGFIPVSYSVKSVFSIPDFVVSELGGELNKAVRDYGRDSVVFFGFVTEGIDSVDEVEFYAVDAKTHSLLISSASFVYDATRRHITLSEVPAFRPDSGE